MNFAKLEQPQKAIKERANERLKKEQAGYQEKPAARAKNEQDLRNSQEILLVPFKLEPCLRPCCRWRWLLGSDQAAPKIRRGGRSGFSVEWD